MAIDHSRAEAGSLAGEALDADEAEFYRDLAAERCTDPGAGWAWDYIGAALAGRSQVEADFADGKNPLRPVEPGRTVGRAAATAPSVSMVGDREVRRCGPRADPPRLP